MAHRNALKLNPDPMPLPPMPAPAPPFVRPSDLSLFLDFDGTLVELADRPDAVSADPDLTSLLERLADRLDGRVAIVSGRSVAQLDGMLGPVAGRMALVGSHGTEVRIAGSAVVAPERDPALMKAEELFAATFAGDHGVIVEVKSLGVAIHYRLAPSAGPHARRLAEDWGSRHGLLVQEGKMMVELRTPGQDKGGGIAALMGDAPFGGRRPVFFGDDVTDEPGFAEVEAGGGFGVLVGAPRPTEARFGLPDIAAVHAWLRAL